jgi:hypothetical protein
VVAETLTGVETVPVAGIVAVIVSASGAMITLAWEVELEGVGVDESVPVTLITCVPFTLYVIEKLDPVPEDGLPPGAVQAKVTGGIPPEAEAVHATALPVVPVAGQLISTVRKHPHEC